MQYRRIMIVLVLLILVVPNIALADIGVPMIFITLPGMLAALIPIILIETYVLSKQLALSFKPSVKAVIWEISVPQLWVFPSRGFFLLSFKWSPEAVWPTG